jgi:DNA-binding transcriptional LysR family regulator
MNLRQLEYFTTIAEEGSITRAAERLFVSQPSLSQQILALEQELGGELLERLPRGVRLTAAGQELLPEARATIRHARRARRSARMALELEAGHLEVATITSAAAGILPTVMQDWQQQYPGIEVSLLEFPHRRALDEAVRDGAGDIAVGSTPRDWPGPCEHLGYEEFVVVLPDGDSLLAGPSVALEALADRRWVHFVQTHGVAAVIDFCCAAAGFAPRVALRTSQVAAAPRFAAAGLGPTLVPSHVVPDALRELARPASPRLVRSVVAFTRTGWAPITTAFIESLRKYEWGRKPAGAIDLG